MDTDTEGRTALDVYNTPDLVAGAVCERILQIVPSPSYIVEPSAGSGAFIKHLRRLYPQTYIVANEIRAEEAPALVKAGANHVYTEDWVSLARRWGMPGAVLIIGNPPFSFAVEHIAAPMDRCGDGAVIAFLLKQNIKGGIGRALNFWPKYPYKYEIPLVPRPSFKKTKKASNDTNEYSVFVWEKGYTGPSVTLWPHIVWKSPRPVRPK